MEFCHILAHRRILRKERPGCRRSKPESYPRTRTRVKRAAAPREWDYSHVDDRVHLTWRPGHPKTNGNSTSSYFSSFQMTSTFMRSRLMLCPLVSGGGWA